jgi:ERCC4-type nuclease
MALQLYGFTSPQSARTIGPNRTQGFHEIHILVGIPGIGLARAQALISHFGSLQKVFSASEKEFRLIEGIGDYLARELVRLFNHGS